MTFLAFRPFRRRKHRNDVIVTSYIKILQILKLKSKDNTKQTLHAKFYVDRLMGHGLTYLFVACECFFFLKSDS